MPCLMAGDAALQALHTTLVHCAWSIFCERGVQHQSSGAQLWRFQRQAAIRALTWNSRKLAYCFLLTGWVDTPVSKFS